MMCRTQSNPGCKLIADPRSKRYQCAPCELAEGRCLDCGAKSVQAEHACKPRSQVIAMAVRMDGAWRMAVAVGWL